VAQAPVEGRCGEDGTSSVEDVVYDGLGSATRGATTNLTSKESVEVIDRVGYVEHALRLGVTQQRVRDDVLNEILEPMPPVADLAVDSRVVATDHAVRRRTHFAEKHRADPTCASCHTGTTTSLYIRGQRPSTPFGDAAHYPIWHFGFALPGDVSRRLSLLATALRAFADDGDRLWTPEPVDAARMANVPGLPLPILETGPLDRLEPVAHTLPWAETSAAAARANHRGLALEAASSIGCALPGARLISSVADLLEHLARGGAAAGSEERWVVKAPYSAAGRLRVLGRGGKPEPGVLRRVADLLDLFGPVLFEPWMEVLEEIGCAARSGGEGTVMLGLHRVEMAPSGAFRRITVPPDPLSPPWLPGGERLAMARAVEAAATALGKAGYSGPFGVDAWKYRDPAVGPRLHPIGEVNARMTFGLVARALVERLRKAGAIDPEAPASLCAGREANHGRGGSAGAVVKIPLLHGAPGDSVALWIESGG
jgi:hypothetical protein